jgi:uncharacterized protein
MTMTGIPRGRICWHELLTTDPEAAPGFYEAVTGWGTEVWDSGEGSYTMWTNDSAPLGGVMRLPGQAAAAGAPSHWLAHISTPDIGATVVRARELGATVLVEESVPTVGAFAIIADPYGAVFSAFEPESEAPGHDGPPTVGEFSWHELPTGDWEGAWSFYSELFGWEKTDAMDLGDMGMYQMYGRGAQPLGGMFNKTPEMAQSAWLCYIRVADMDASLEKVRELGGQVMSGPLEVPGGDVVAQCMDPSGAAFALHSTAQS